MSLVIWMAVAIAVVFAISLYNSLVSVKNAVSKAWANIDVLLKQRHDELPKLVDTCKQYMQHEQTTLERVIQARTRVADAREAKNIGALGAAESALRSGLGSLLALVESYPELKANEQFLHLQSKPKSSRMSTSASASAPESRGVARLPEPARPGRSA